VSEDIHDEAEEPATGPLRRTLDFFVFAPVGLALTAVEDLPGLISKGRQRVETEISNARIVGQFVVGHGQREIADRVGNLFNRDSPESSREPTPPEAGAPNDQRTSPTADAADAADAAAKRNKEPAPAVKPPPDPADAAIVEQALAGYDTLSASQVVRRLESLGPDELRAIHRHEASHRNRRTILNRTNQLANGTGTEHSSVE